MRRHGIGIPMSVEGIIIHLLILIRGFYSVNTVFQIGNRIIR